MFCVVTAPGLKVVNYEHLQPSEEDRLATREFIINSSLKEG